MRVSGTSAFNSIKFTRFFLLIICAFFLTSEIKAQVGQLEFAGRCVKDGIPLPGAIVTVYRNGIIQQEQVKVGRNGKFRFFLVFGVDYKITFSYPGCTEMYMMVYTGKLAKERSDLFPLYMADIPFIDNASQSVRISKFRSPFTKVIFDGKKAFVDDEAYLAEFQKDLLIDPAEQARLLAEKEAKERAEKDKLEAEEKAKRDAEEKARKDAEARVLAAKQKAEEEAREAELARMKKESENATQNEDHSMETEAIRLQREKEQRELLAKKNKEIKTKYVNDLLKMVAENERLARQKAFDKQKSDARTNTVIEQMRRESELKAKADNLREAQKQKQLKEFGNRQYKANEMKKLVQAAAFAERAVRISNQRSLPDVAAYKRPNLPNIAVTVDDGLVKTIRTTIVTQGSHMDTYRKETYFWGTVACYRNDVEIDETTYNMEIAYYLAYRNK